MGAENPLLPMAFDKSKSDENSVPLSTLPRARAIRDRDAGGTAFHTRGTDVSKRKIEPDQSNEHSSRKNRKYQTSDMIDIITTSDDFVMEDDAFLSMSTQKRLKSAFLSSDFNNYPSSESLIHAERLPSSPPLQSQNEESDNEFNSLADKTFILPSSPQKLDEFQTPLCPATFAKKSKPVGSKSLSQRSQSNPFFERKSVEEFDFGIDKFNRVQGVHSDQPSSELGLDDQVLNKKRESGESYARDVISQSFENQRTELHLDSLELTSIPEEIEDLKNLVFFDKDGSIGKPKLQIYVAHNNIKIITPRLFELGDMVEVLSLMSNKLKWIPGAISKLKDLKYLNVGANNIQSLPHEILELDKLQNLLLRPNISLLEVEDFDDAQEVHPSSEIVTNKKRRYVGKLKFINRHEHTINHASIMMTRNLSILSARGDSEFDQQLSQNVPLEPIDREEQILLKANISNVPRLTELCLRKFSSYRTSKSETKKWSKSVGYSTSRLVAKAFHQGAFGETCFSCKNTVIQHVAEVIEWWDIADTKSVPIKKRFCCGRCVKEWEKQIKEILAY